MEDLKEEADKLGSQSGFGLFLLKPTVATLPWGVETRGEMSQVLSLESRSPWATAVVLPRHLQCARSPGPPDGSTQVTRKASVWTDLTVPWRPEKVPVQSLACAFGR